MKVIFTFLATIYLIFSFQVNTNAQTTWVKTYNIDYPPSHTHFDTATVGPLEMCTTPDGTILTLMQINQDDDVWLVALDSLGEIKWKRIAGHHGGIFHEDSYSLHSTSDNGCVYFFRHEGSYIEDIAYRINSLGGQLWAKHYYPLTTGMQDLVESIVPTYYNTFYLQFKDSLVELDNSGNLIRFRIPFSYTGQITALPDSDFIFVDSSLIIKEDFSGNQRWSLSAPNFTVAYANASFIYARSFSQVMKINTTNGNVIWTKAIYARTLAMTSDEGFVVASGYQIAKYDSSGTLEWSKSLPLQCGVRNAVGAPNKTYVAGGTWKTMDAYYNSAGDGWSPIFTRIDSAGNGIADSTDYFYNANANDNSILSFADDAVFVAAAIGNSGSKRDTLTIGREPGKNVFATNWSSGFPVGMNYKYSDVDGNGVVDTSDVNLLGYLYTQKTVSPHWRSSAPTINNSVIKFVFENNSINYTDTIKIDVILASPNSIIDSIYGLSFEFGLFGIYPSGQIINSIITVPPSGLGNPGQDLMNKYFNWPQGLPLLTAMVICRTDYSNVSLSGDTIAKLYYVYPASSMVMSPVTMSIRYNAITVGGYPVTLNVLTDTIHLIGSVGIKQLEDFGIRIFPNPSSDQIIFSIEEMRINELAIFDQTGRKINSIDSPGEKYVLDVRDFAEGIYFVQVESDLKVSRAKFLVVH